MTAQAFPTLVDAIVAHAKTTPDRTALAIEDETLTYAELVRRVERVSGGLAERGIGPGHSVALVLPNCVEFVITWLALTRCGATAAPVNTALPGDGLAAALSLSGAQIVIADHRHLPALAEALPSAPAVGTVVVRGGSRSSLAGVSALSWEDLEDTPHAPPPHVVRPGDASILLFTSGSTGRSKACVLPHRYVTRQAEIFAEQLGLSSNDTLFCPFPLFHADAAIFTVAPALLLGGTAALVERFSVQRFWDQVRRYRATVFDFMGATLTMLSNRPPAPDDAVHTARLGWGVPLPDWAPEFERRFGIELVEVYGLSDAGIVLYNRPGEPRRPGSCGRPVAPFDVRVLDLDGFELAPGAVGEICIRPREPHVLLSEYLGMPEATVRAWRDLWFHTGDLARVDADGYFYFVGRDKDVIRRRGENISAPEIENAVAELSAVFEVAAYGVPSPLTEDDVMVAVVPRAGHALDAATVLEHCRTRLARHMVPRYVEFHDGLPRTPTEKVDKPLLMSRGVTAATIDSDTTSGRSR